MALNKHDREWQRKCAEFGLDKILSWTEAEAQMEKLWQKYPECRPAGHYRDLTPEEMSRLDK